MKHTLLFFLCVPLLTFAEEPSPEYQAEMNPLIQKEQALREALDALHKQQEAVDKKYGMGKPASPSFPAGEAPSKWYETLEEDFNLRIRHTLDANSDDFAEPALFTFTHPASGSDTWAADVGLGMGRQVQGTDIDWLLQSEYHYSDGSSPNDTFTAGVGLEGGLGKRYTRSDRPALGANWKWEANYKRDNLIAGESFATAVNLFPMIGALRLGGYMIGNDGCHWFKGQIEPFLGAEFEAGNGASDAFRQGERFTLRAGLTAKGYLFPSRFGERIELTTKISYWANVTTSGLYELYDDNQLWFTGSLTYWLDTRDKNDKLHKHFGITARYENGDNPVKGIFDQDVITLGFAVKF